MVLISLEEAGAACHFSAAEAKFGSGSKKENGRRCNKYKI